MSHAALNPLRPSIFETIISLSEDEKKAILNLPVRTWSLRADADIVREEIDLRNVVFWSKVSFADTKFFPTASGRSWRSMCPATSPIS